MKRKLSIFTLLILFNFNNLISQSLNYCKWQYKREIIIDHSQNPENVSDYSVLITINTIDLITTGKVKPDGSDFRFTTDFSDNLEYWIEPGIQNEFGMNQVSTHIWVKIPSITANSTKTIYMLYGNPNANPKSSISSTFLFGDDFDDNNFDAQKWQFDFIAAGSINEQNNRLEHSSPPSFPESTGSILSQQSFTGAVVVDMQFKKGGYVYRGAGLYDAFNSMDNRAIFFWQDFGPFGPQLNFNSNNIGQEFRSDFWSREFNPEYYLRIYRKADGSFRFVSEIPSFEEDGYKYWEHTFPNLMSTDIPLKVGAHDFVWQAASPTWDRYEDNIRVRKYSEPEPIVSIQVEENLVLQNIFTENVSICENENYSWQGNTYSQTGIYSLNFTTSEGCDSILNLNLEVNPSYHFDENKIISNGTIYTWHEQNLTSEGVYTANYSTSKGCDSVFTLNLTVSNNVEELCNWQFKREVLIDHTQNPENVTDYSVLVVVNTAELISQGKMKIDGSDIRFTSDFTDNLEYWIEPGIQNEFAVNDDATHIWVKIPTIHANSSKIIYMLYGNPSAISKSNISTTFLFGDDFDDNSLDDSKWQTNYISNGMVNEQNGRIEHNSPAMMPEATGNIMSQIGFTGPIVMDMQFKKGGYVYRGAGLQEDFNSTDNRALFFWQDFGPFGPQLHVNSTSEVVDFRNDYWSREFNPEYYLRIYRKPDSTFRFTTEIPAFEEDGYKYWDHTITSKKMPLDIPLKVSAHDFVWQNAWWLWDRYEDNIRVRKYSEPEPTISLSSNELNNGSYDEVKLCIGDSVLWNGNYYKQAGTFTIINSNPIDCSNTQTLVLNFHPNYEFSETHTICEGNVFNWNGVEYNQSGIYTQNFVSINGCDSIVTLNLIVNPSFYSHEIYTICEGQSFTWQNQSYTQPGVYFANYLNVNGCDSVYSLSLNFNPIFTQVENQTICSGSNYFWQGINYSESGIYTNSFTDVNGCDSSYVLNLNVTEPYFYNENQTICEGDSYFWQGNNYSTSGIYSLNFTSIYGCDSIYQLNLIVKPTYHFSETVTICEGESYFWQGSNYSQAGTYSQIYQSNYACDSIYDLTLNIIPIYASTENENICPGETFIWHGNEYSQAGSYVLNFTNANGCDSILTLNLNVNGLNTNVTIFSNSLFSMQNGATYQWLDCQNNYNEIFGANEQSFTPTQTGQYAVEIRQENCIDTSNCFFFNYINLFENEYNLFTIYPNPVTDNLFLNYNISDVRIEYTIVNALGEIISKSVFIKKDVIDMSPFAAGLYTIILRYNDNVEYHKFMKE